ncbi:AEC family transporter [Myceligenerans pegani]|uniref:AEC family transporter n=1 Tax=Myceligenerans pegani TaxID=2776917 RepID=A0ABR9N318_9MICO|nr:AEC family transporter [Myceligenerans sp. TRM 65318]MBE1878041.1 AEC family transporter [Myceligenerans sp. TRM 65318]MBE3020312.1 AEC family transporter [Myceligenerans sp. TRM 65318]
MHDVLLGFTTIAAVIAVGYGIAAVRLLDEHAQTVLTQLSFFVASPCLLFVVVSETDVAGFLSRNLVATAAGVVAAAIPYVLVAALVQRRRADEIAIGAMCSAYCNAGNLGLPVAAYVLGDAALIAPMLLLQLGVLQPIALMVLDAGREGARRTRTEAFWRAARLPFTNPLTVATLLGLAISLTGLRLPDLVMEPVGLVGGLAVPGVLIAYGISLRLGPLPGRGVPAVELGFVTFLKLVVQPLGAYAAGRLLGVDDVALLALTVTAALPSAQNIFVHATRFGRAELLARDAIFVTTIGSVPAITVITLLVA